MYNIGQNDAQQHANDMTIFWCSDDDDDNALLVMMMTTMMLVMMCDEQWCVVLDYLLGRW